MEKGIQIALRYLENKLTRLINRGVLIKLTQSQNNYSNLHFYCSTLVFNIYFFEFAKLLGGGGPPAPPHATALQDIRVEKMRPYYLSHTPLPLTLTFPLNYLS